jgi:hypothetical protein
MFVNMTEVVNAPGEVETKTPADVKVEAPAETKPAETVGEVFNQKKSDETVPLSTFIELKKESKAAQKQIKELQDQIANGATKKEISAEIKAIADEHNVDEGFLQKLVTAVKAQTESEVEERISSKLKPLEEKDKAEKINTIFSTHFAKAMEEMPEYKDIVNKDVIKSLSLDPANKNKTFTKIIENAYGHLVTGKKTIEGTSPRGGKDDNQTLDTSRLKDPAYFKEIKANPALLKEYNDGLVKRLNL